MKCNRCKCETNVYTVSWFNTEEICPACSIAECSHPDIKKAKAADHAAVKRGNYNFAGIGLPQELK